MKIEPLPERLVTANRKRKREFKTQEAVDMYKSDECIGSSYPINPYDRLVLKFLSTHNLLNALNLLPRSFVICA